MNHFPFYFIRLLVSYINLLGLNVPALQVLFAFNYNFRVSRHKYGRFKMQKLKVNGCKYTEYKSKEELWEKLMLRATWKGKRNKLTNLDPFSLRREILKLKRGAIILLVKCWRVVWLKCLIVYKNVTKHVIFTHKENFCFTHKRTI